MMDIFIINFINNKFIPTITPDVINLYKSIFSILYSTRNFHPSPTNLYSYLTVPISVSTLT